MKLEKEDVLALLKPGGNISNALSSFEVRSEQLEMLSTVIDAYNDHLIALIEAGTGTGKSMAYLIPALINAVNNQEKTLISTHTINLQQQLFEKDFPLIEKALGIQLKAVIVKGMGNYLCLKKLQEAPLALIDADPEEQKQLQVIEAWSNKTLTGCRSSLSIQPSGNVWDKVAAESDTCTKRRCPFYEKCFFMNARKEALDAQIIISNHSLFFHDLNLRSEKNNYEDPALLPPYRNIILDEAHTIEEAATNALADKCGRLDFIRLLSKLAHPKGGKIQALAVCIQRFYSKLDPSLVDQLTTTLLIDLPGSFKDLFKEINDFFDALTAYIRQAGKEEINFRLRPSHTQDTLFIETVASKTAEISRIIQTIDLRLSALFNSTEDFDKTFLQAFQPLKGETATLVARLKSRGESLTQFVSPTFSPNRVRFVEIRNWKGTTNIYLVHADLDLSERLEKTLFSQFPTIVLTSATLSTNNGFDYVRKRLGIDQAKEKQIAEKIISSPFNYEKQALFALPNDLVPPNSPQFLDQAVELIEQAVQKSRGCAFILFTSYSQMKQCYDRLQKSLEKQKFCPLVQGSQERGQLIEKFKKSPRSILFATSSFWQGVDVVGDQLRLVVIVKLPFQVPSEPLTEARTESIEKNGGNAFFDYSIPNAIQRFKQGFGRLIRNKKDRGCILCLDSRLVQKPYGKLFLDSLPKSRFVIDKKQAVIQKLAAFYKNS